LTSRFDVSLVGSQLQYFDAVAETQVAVTPTHFSQSAGLTAFYDDKNFLYLRLYRSESLASNALGIVLVENGAKQEFLNDRVALGLQRGGAAGTPAPRDAAVSLAPTRRGSVLRHRAAIDASYLSDEPTRGFPGTMIGMTCIDSYRRNLVARFAYFDRQQRNLRFRLSTDQCRRRR
jgi:xylan 1,4-beta-xylosidase